MFLLVATLPCATPLVALPDDAPAVAPGHAPRAIEVPTDFARDEAAVRALGVALRHLEDGNPALALEILEPLSTRHDDVAIVHASLGSALARTERWGAADAAFQRTMALSVHDLPVRRDAANSHARVLAHLGQWRRSVRALEIAWRSGHRDLDVWRADPVLEPLGEIEAFRALLERCEVELIPFPVEIAVHHTFEGAAPGEMYGATVADIGDVDGDGAHDVAIAAPFAVRDGHAVGRVELRSGRSGEVLHEWWGTVPDGRFGHALGRTGDVDGDGVADLIVGAPGNDAVTGRIEVLSGRDGGTILARAAETAGSGYGSEARGVGDWDGDGTPDLLVGIPGFDVPAGTTAEDTTARAEDAGRVEILSGLDLSLLYAFDGPSAGARAGSAAWGAARDDGHFLVIGAGGSGPEGTGEAFLFRGEEPTLLARVTGGRRAGSFGEGSVSLVGDVDADGVPDFAIADWRDGSYGRWSGRVVVHSGETGEEIRAYTGWTATGFGTGDLTAGDVDLDGHADLFIGSWLSNRGARGGGAATLISGGTGEHIATWPGLTPGDHVGYDAAGIGDVDGDGALDFVLSAATSAFGGIDRGRVFIISGPCYLRGEFPEDLSGSHDLPR